MTTQTDPVVFVAVLCERVLREQDSVISLIRMVDRFFVPAALVETPGSSTAAPMVSMTVFLALRANDYRGTCRLRVRHVSPNGEASLMEQEVGLAFRDDQLINNLTISTGVPARLIGPHTFEVLSGDQVVARLPFRLELANASEAGQAQKSAT